MNPRLPRPPRSFRPTHLVQRRLRLLGFAEKHEWLTSNLGKELGFVDHELLEPCGTPVTSAGGFELLCSYNWRRRRGSGGDGSRTKPQIFVPGEAPALVPRSLPVVTRTWARGRSFRDVNAALMPAYPFEPMFRAVGVMRPEFRFDDVDLVINRNSLHHLFRLADGGRCKDAFRLDLAMVNDTLIVTPLWQKLSDKGNYGRIFEQYFTRHRASLAESQSHHRAIRYDLGPLKIAVLCEVDAECALVKPWRPVDRWQVETKPRKPATPLDDAFSLEASAERRLFSALRRDKSFRISDVKLDSGLPEFSSGVQYAGKGTLSAYTAEMATMKCFGDYNTAKMPQLWLGRTPYFIESRHSANVFTDIRITWCGPQLQRFEETHQDALQKLVTAIKMLTHFTARAPGRHGIAVCTKQPRTLRVFEAADRPESPVPQRIQRRFWDNGNVELSMGNRLESLRRQQFVLK